MYYVDGGIYPGEKEFSLVRPGDGGKDDRPYVYKSPRQSMLTRHHSHHYLLSRDYRSVSLVKSSPEALPGESYGGMKGRKGVLAPNNARLSKTDYEGVKQRIEEGDIYDH